MGKKPQREGGEILLFVEQDAILLYSTADDEIAHQSN